MTRLLRPPAHQFPRVFSREEGNAVEEALLGIVTTINNYLSNYILIILLLGMGIWFTVRTKAIQFRCFGEGWRRVFGNFSLRGGNQGGGMTSFQALSTAIAAQVGTGNIVGACGAIIVGGPGAIFWMWIIALLGMATNYAEAVMAQKTRVVDEDGTVHGGPVYYITTAFKGNGGKFLAGFFAVAIILALGFMGCMVQSNSIAETMNTAFGIPTWVMGLIVVILAGTVFIGGVSRLAAVTEKIVPVMAIFYVLGSLVVLIMNAANIPATFALIFQCAFNPDATVGGATFRHHRRHQPGRPSAACSPTRPAWAPPRMPTRWPRWKDPHEQGVVAMIGVFVDTIIVVTMTALVVLSVLSTWATASPHRRLRDAHRRDHHQDQHRPAGLRAVLRRERGRLVRGYLPSVLRLLHHPLVEPVR